MDMERLQKIADILEVGVVDIISVEEKAKSWETNYHHNQEGNYNFYAENTKMIELLEKTVADQQVEILFLRKEMEKLTDTLQRMVK